MMPEPPHHLSRTEAADRLGISVSHLDRLIQRHRVPVLRFGRRVVLDATAIAALEAACRAVPRSPPATDWPTPKAPLGRRKSSAWDDAMAMLAESKQRRRAKGGKS